MDAATGIESEDLVSLREQIHYTQAELGHKIDTLEYEVRSAATLARERLRGVVDVRQQIGKHPLAACMLAGTVGIFFGLRRQRASTMAGQQGPQSLPPWPLRLLAPELSTIRAFLVGRALSAAGEWFASSRGDIQLPRKK